MSRLEFGSHYVLQKQYARDDGAQRLAGLSAKTYRKVRACTADGELAEVTVRCVSVVVSPPRFWRNSHSRWSSFRGLGQKESANLRYRDVPTVIYSLSSARKGRPEQIEPRALQRKPRLGTF